MKKYTHFIDLFFKIIIMLRSFFLMLLICMFMYMSLLDKESK